MGRPPCCDKSNVKRGLWTAEEDAKILAYVSNHGIGNWTLVPKIAGLNRCGKRCRLRWTNYLRPDLKHDSFTQQEEALIISLHKAIGSSEFHLNDPLVSVKSLKQEMQELQGVISSYNPSGQMQNEICLPRICNGDIYNMHEVPNMASGSTWNCSPCGGPNSKQFEGPPSSVDSFVDAILNRVR